MEAVHYALWERCRDFVGHVCADRDASHGLAHMETVTKSAVMLYLMSRSRDSPVEATTLSRVILVGMLHDVADHKYDHDGQLMQRVHDFVATEASNLDPAMTSSDGTAAVNTVLHALEAVSYSKENKRGMRWFESCLPREWVVVRDYVSDADKLDAIGADGLLRCYEYTCAVFRTKSQTTAPGDAKLFPSVSALEAALLKDVADHYDEKLCRLTSEFIVTREGKFLAEPRHDAMGALLVVWKAQGPPPVTLFWPDAARYCCGV